ncbi:hypothetical protein M404DRAFT_171547 [Pisolithus tinctorius Marx 270]|uniref:FAS1 domain-containing protein n=1 Tax=Pisolithus tinctorius Marx 270 TaxID=870435 RepID=A0A0C3J6D4_PISTI|nr:hypothetical protein M404DRAFT_171547 [Pisolithus tinctorius Marx 270]
MQSQQSGLDEDYTPMTRPQPTLADLLTIEPSASIYYSYARETELSLDFDTGDQYLTLLVPTNRAVMALARKPHQGPPSTVPIIELSEQQFDEQSKRNVYRWVSAHIIPSRISLSNVPVTYDTLLEGKSVTLIPTSKTGQGSPNWSRVTLEDGSKIISVKEAMNGVLYLIDGTVDPY